MRFFYTALAFVAVPTAVLAATHTVMVGAGGMLKFDPDSVTAAVDDTVKFIFMAKNHSVTQSSFGSPCTRAMFNGTPGVSSGFLAIPPNSSPQNGSQPTWSITIKQTTPLWFYCAQKMPVAHCAKGMVISINPTQDKTQAAFLAAAMASNSTAAPPSGTSGSATVSGAASSATGSGVAAAAANSTRTAFAASGTAAADNAQVKKNGVSGIAFTRGTAGLFSVAAAVGAILF